MIILRRPYQVTLVQVAALLPPVAVAIAGRGVEGLRALGVALIVTLIWDLVFARARKAPPAWHGVTTGLIVVVMTPPDLPLWQLGLALSFGTVIGEQVFGGRGFGFLNAAVVSLAFLVFSFPGIALAGSGREVALAVLPGLILLTVTGMVFWRVLVGLIAGVVLAHLVAGGGAPEPGMIHALAFGGVFLVADPVASASTRGGRWIYGLFAGCLIASFAAMGAPQVLVFAALLASLAAPLIDNMVVLVRNHSMRGKAWHG